MATPMRCQYTETSLRSASRWTLNVFSTPWARGHGQDGDGGPGICSQYALPVQMSRKAEIEKAQPKLMPAVTATWPTRLNQPVNQTRSGALLPGASLAAQW